jgi:hypothetical protein
MTFLIAACKRRNLASPAVEKWWRDALVPARGTEHAIGQQQF